MLFIFVSPVLGFLLGALLMVLVANVFRRASPLRVDNLFRRLQLGLGRALQPGPRRQRRAEDDRHHLDAADRLGLRRGRATTLPPAWVIWCCYIAIGLGTMFGGWRIVKTMGQRITKLKPVGGFCAETGGAITLFLATALGIPVSTTHTITGAIVGVGSVRRAAAVRWGLAGNIVWAWIFTIPASAFVAAVFYALGVWLLL